MIRHTLAAGLALALVLFFTSSAQAQFGGRGLQIPPTVQNVMLLNTKEVQKELTLSEEQTKGVSDIGRQMQSDMMEIMSGLQDLTPEERKQELPGLMKMVSEKAKDLQGKVDKILDAKQTARMKELSLQRRGVEALSDEEVIASLKLTPEQLKNLEAIRDSAAEKQQEIFQELTNRGGDQQAVREKIMSLRKELGDKALAVLTDAQREQFDKMKGAKFEFPRGRQFGF